MNPYDQRLKLISTFRNNMENILKWNNEVAFFHRDFYDDCKSLTQKIDDCLKKLLNSSTQEDRLDVVYSFLNELTQENSIFSKTKVKLLADWDKIKNNNFPNNIINEVFEDENVIPRNEISINEQNIITTKEKISQACAPLHNDINSVEAIFYNEFYSIANNLKNILKKNTSKRLDSNKKDVVLDNVLKHFTPSICIFNLYVSINIQQKFYLKFKDEIDQIAIAEAQENVPEPIIRPPNMKTPSFIQSNENNSFSQFSPSLFNNNFTLNNFQNNGLRHQNSLRNSTNSSIFRQKPSSIASNDIPRNDNFKLIIEQLQNENMRLKAQLQNYEQLQNENKKLKEQIETYEQQLNENDIIISELAEGNEELQTENDNLRALIEDSS